MPRIYDVIRCTTETLIRGLNDASRDGATVEQITHVGGRDWVVIAYRDKEDG